MVTIGISEFRANISTILRRVQAGEIIMLMQRGKEVARLVPPNFARTVAQQELARLRQSAVVGDVLAPISDPWEAAG